MNTPPEPTILRLVKPAILTSLCVSAILGQMHAQSTSTEPIGFNKVVCLVNSDTVVGIPFRVQGSQRTMLSAVPGVNGDSATLTFSNTNFTPGEFSKHYLKFVDGYRAGRWYPVETAAPNVAGGPNGTPNTATQVTIFLNGDTLSDGGGSVAIGTKVIIAQYWTLDTLFPPVASAGVTGPTTAWTLNTETGVQVPNGHAIVPSPNTSNRSRLTQVLIPNFAVSSGINQAPYKICYISGDIWQSVDGITGAGSIALDPDTFITIRHPLSVQYHTVFRSLGEVETGTFTIPLFTSTSDSQDCYVGLPRPVDVRLNQLNLIESGAFVASGTISNRDRKDQILIFNNAQQLINRSPSAIYYYTGGSWLNALASNAVSDNDIIPAGAGFMVRKAKTTTGATAMWLNTPSYLP